MSDLWDRLQADLLINFPENYSANVKLIKEILAHKATVHPAAVVTSYFTIISGLTAEYFYTDQGSSTTLYNVAIAKSGGGKDIAIHAIPKVLNSIEETYKNSLTPNILTSNITSVAALDKIFEDNRLIVLILDEFGDKLGQMQEGGHSRELKDKFKELYSLTNKKYESKSYSRSNTANEEKVVREYPCFILSGVTTKTQLLSRLKKAMVHDGFLNRFIFIDGNDSDPYTLPKPDYGTRHLQQTNDKAFKDALSFHEKIRGYENTPIEFSEEAHDYYYDVIGDPYSEGTDIYDFCKNINQDHETNVVMSTRWRENALRLATAITAYEFGVNHTKEEIVQFQEESQGNRAGSVKSTASVHTDEIDDPTTKLLEEKIDELFALKKGFKKENGYKYETKIVHPSLKKEDTSTGADKYNEMISSLTDVMLKQSIGNTDDPKLRKAVMKKIKKDKAYKAIENSKSWLIKTIEEQKPTELDYKTVAFKDVYTKGQDSANRITLYLKDLTGTEFGELIKIAASSKSKSQTTHNNKLAPSLKPLSSHKPLFIKPPFSTVPLTTPITPIVQLKKDILEWAYNFVKAQSIKFYNVFHEEVEQSQYDKDRKKAIAWFNNNYVDENSWYTLTHLGENVRGFRIGSSSRRKLLKDLVDEGIIEQKKVGSASSYRFIVH